jgi:hypothetical protein
MQTTKVNKIKRINQSDLLIWTDLGLIVTVDPGDNIQAGDIILVQSSGSIPTRFVAKSQEVLDRTIREFNESVKLKKTHARN